MIINSGLIGGSSPDILYSGTVSGMRFSTVNGTAFVDVLPSAILALLAQHPGNLWFESYASGLMLKGVLKEAGSAEGLGGEAQTNWNFASWTGDNPDNWSVLNEDANNYVTEAAGKARIVSNNTATIALRTSYTSTAGTLIKEVTIIDSVTGGVQSTLRYGGVPETIIAAGTYTGYRTDTGVNEYEQFSRFGVCDVVITSSSYKPVTAPSTAGAVIVSAKGSATQNWAVNQWVAASYNLASYSCIIRKIR